MSHTQHVDQRHTSGGSAARAGGAGGSAPEPPSVVVLTRNEEENIATCLRGLAFTDDVVVLDSFSTDRTVEIARQFPNVRVVSREFDTEYKQRNFSLHEIRYKHPWLYICDADELVPADLVSEILGKINDPSLTDAAYRLRYKNFYLGKWIKHASGYPVWIIRLVRPERVSYEVRATNIHPIVSGNVGELNGHFLHYSFNSGLTRWFSKHNFYSTREAIEGAKVREGGLPSWRALRARDPMLRRRTLKNLSYFLKGRALWRFLYTYFLRHGWLDGLAGLHYCSMVGMYEYWIELKVRECEAPWDARTSHLASRVLHGGRSSARDASPAAPAPVEPVA